MVFALASCTSGDPDPAPTDEDTPVVTATDTPTPTETPTGTETPEVPAPTPSANMAGVSATGGFGEEPELTVPDPWGITSTQYKVLVQGKGPVVSDAGLVQVNYLGKNGRTGVVFDESYTKGAPVTLSLSQIIPGWVKALVGQRVGSRILVAIPGADGYDASGGRESAGILLGDTLVFVIDVVQAEVTVPTGTAVTVTNPDLPKVEGELDKPTLSFPGGNPPTDLVVQPLIKGEGAALVAEDYIEVNYVEYVWASRSLVRQTYGYSPLMDDLASTIPGWKEALVGQTVGSRILLIVPPAKAYPEGNPDLGVPVGSTMVYVIDIMFAAQS
jgi:peptidylprolyl isomerase